MSDYHRHDTYNASTGLPTLGGGVDIGGYTIGQNHWDRHTSPTSSFSSHLGGATVNHGSSTFDSSVFRSNAHDASISHQTIGIGLSNNLDLNLANHASAPQNSVAQIVFTAFVGTVTLAGFVAIILGFIGVF